MTSDHRDLNFLTSPRVFHVFMGIWNGVGLAKELMRLAKIKSKQALADRLRVLLNSKIVVATPAKSTKPEIKDGKILFYEVDDTMFFRYFSFWLAEHYPKEDREKVDVYARAQKYGADFFEYFMDDIMSEYQDKITFTQIPAGGHFLQNVPMGDKGFIKEMVDNGLPFTFEGFFQALRYGMKEDLEDIRDLDLEKEYNDFVKEPDAVKKSKE